MEDENKAKAKTFMAWLDYYVECSKGATYDPVTCSIVLGPDFFDSNEIVYEDILDAEVIE